MSDCPFVKQHSIDAWQYADDVITGKILANKLIILACERFMALIEREDVFYCERAANRAVNFIQGLPHTKGRWASKRELLNLEPWQKFIVCSIFAFLDEHDMRLVNIAFILVCRKNGKSILAAAIGLYMFCADGEFGAEVYSGASGEKQAWEVFRPAKLICERTPQLTGHYDIQVNAKSIVIPTDGSRLEPLIGNPGDGQSPHCAIVDEYHEHDSDNLYQTMETGMGAREQPLMLVISTAGTNLAGPCLEMQRDMERILNGDIPSDNVFAAIYSCDEDDEWDSDEALIKANPNLDVSVSKKWMFQQRDKARRSAAKQNFFRTKHLNQWVGSKVAWMNMLAWRRQMNPDAFEVFKQAPCMLSVDLASRKDVAVINGLFKNGNEYFAKTWFFVPEAAVEENEEYQKFVTAGEMVSTPGNKTDQAFIEAKLKELNKEFDVRSMAFDDWQADYMMSRLMEDGLPVVNYNQTVKNMSTPMKQVEAEILDGKLFHDGNSCMTAMMGRVAARIDEKDNTYPTKESKSDPFCKIDGAVALIMGMGIWLAEDPGGTLDDYLNNPVRLSS